jgi:23S rRNA (adenine2503-C2)-methyltransferase
MTNLVTPRTRFTYKAQTLKVAAMIQTPKTRQAAFTEHFPNEPAFRWKQIEKALYTPGVNSWEDVSTLSPAMLTTLAKELPWVSFFNPEIHMSQKKDTYKAILNMADGQRIETVLMENRREQWTICVSSQVGCAMGCTFCSTGKMGFLRNLNIDEITDQYRFWADFLGKNPELPQRISNVVFMGMGEPLNNYETVKETIRLWLRQTDLGHSKITVSTVGVLSSLKKLIVDEDWPHVRLAISLHSADVDTRNEIVPTSYDEFLPQLQDWCHKYLHQSGNRKHHLTFEYVMLQDVNDTPMHAKKLAQFCHDVGISQVKANLIPYNFTDLGFQRSVHERTSAFKHILEEKGVTVTVRKTMGDDIAAACGQLITIG